MSLITLIVTLLAVGLLMWAINTYVPLEPGIKRLLNIAVIVLLILWLLSALGLLPNLNAIRVGG
jgi:hypothetical protein